MNDRYSKLAFLHWVKERKTLSLSAQLGQFCTLFPEGGVVWKIPYIITVVPMSQVMGELKLNGYICRGYNTSCDCEKCET